MKTIALGLLCLALALVCAPALVAQETQAPLRIAASADLHVNPAYRTSGVVNPLEPYHLQLVDAFLWDAQQRGADVLLLDPARFKSNENLSDPRCGASGLDCVIVNGEIAVRNGAHTHVRSGEIL